MAGRSLVAVLVCVLALPGCGGTAGQPAKATHIDLVSFQRAAVVFGQPIIAFHEPNQGQATPSADSLFGPGKPAGAGLYLPDIGNNRVLGFHATPIINNLAATFVLGQPGFAFGGAAVAPTGMRGPTCAAVIDGRLFVADSANHRVLVWHGEPTGNATPAAFALGQPDLISRTPAAGASGMNAPGCLSGVGGRIAVADPGNHRVLLWLSMPHASAAPAHVVLGQADFDGIEPNRGAGPARDTLNDPTGVWSDGERLVVADRANNRVLVWTSFPTQSGQPADLVLGQPDFTSGGPGHGATGCHLPADVSCNGEQLFVADAGSHRVLVWDAFPRASGTPANHVLGQATFEGDAPNDDNQDGAQDLQPSGRTFSSANAMLMVHAHGDQLFVGDTGNHRLLIFQSR